MFQRILVPLDGSARAERAIPIAARIARASGGTVVLLRIVNAPAEFWPSFAPPLPSATMQTMAEVGRMEATKYLEDIARSTTLVGIETKPEILFGPVASTLLSAARSHQVDLIVMCSRGSNGESHWALGSVAEKVTRHAPVPVFVLSGDGSALACLRTDTGHPVRALVPLDGSPLAEAALVPASHLLTALSSPAQGELHLLLVVKLPPTIGKDNGRPPLNPDLREYLQQEVNAYMHAVMDRLRKGPLADHHCLVTWSIVFDVDVADALIRIAENGEEAEDIGVRGSYDMIVMTTHGRGGLQEWTLGSMAVRVLGATKLPLLIVQPPKSKKV